MTSIRSKTTIEDTFYAPNYSGRPRSTERPFDFRLCCISVTRSEPTQSFSRSPSLATSSAASPVKQCTMTLRKLTMPL
uniref:Uncharacterized protein n=1 Tax=Steinernema glaseri TaxID=37863 RepID=A0A1I7Y230_9BILA